MKFAEEELKKAPNLDNCYLFVIGQVGRMHFQKRKKAEKNAFVDGEFLYTTQNPTLYRAMEIAQIILDKFEKGNSTRFTCCTRIWSRQMFRRPEWFRFCRLTADTSAKRPTAR